MSVTNADDMAVPSARRLSWLEIFCYALPPVGAGYMFCLVTLYTMKFSTDVLLIAPALMGTIYGLSRFWDAIYQTRWSAIYPTKPKPAWDGGGPGCLAPYCRPCFSSGCCQLRQTV